MHVGILGGTGPLGRGLGLRLAVAGATVTIGSRDAERAAEVVGALHERWPDRGLEIRGGPNQEAAACDVVVVATPWDAALPTVRALADALSGKLVVSVGNALVKQGRELHALVPPRGSIAAAVQAELPGSLVAAAGHHLPASVLEDLDGDLLADVLVCSDRAEATTRTMALMGSIPGLRPLDAGSLASASAVEAFTAVLVNLNIRYKAHSTLRLAGLDHV
jgi:NADPH-dependent F420 reductase